MILPFPSFWMYLFWLLLLTLAPALSLRRGSLLLLLGFHLLANSVQLQPDGWPISA
jgi:hypothetical protein